MAQKTIVQLIDDLDGGEAAESVSFGLDGVEYTIDLSSKNAKRLRDGLDVYVDHAQRIGGRKQRVGATTTVKASTDRAQNQAIREWARTQNRSVSDRGRIPAEIVAEFHKAHARG